MEFAEAKRQFIQTWGQLGSEWGINRTMAQIHALLLISTKPLSAEEVMAELQISRGNANMNLRDLINWTLVYKELVPGDRKEYFKAEKDIWEIAKRVAKERKRREIEPVRRVLDQLAKVENPKDDSEIEEFKKMVSNVDSVVGRLDNTVDLMLKADENWFFSSIFKVFK